MLPFPDSKFSLYYFMINSLFQTFVPKVDNFRNVHSLLVCENQSVRFMEPPMKFLVIRASLVAQMVRLLPAMRETQKNVSRL